MQVVSLEIILGSTGKGTGKVRKEARKECNVRKVSTVYNLESWVINGEL